MARQIRDRLLGAAIAAHKLCPERARKYIEPAIVEGNADAAASLALSLHDYQRADLAYIMYRHRCAPAAFRASLDIALSQTHCYSHALRHARSWRQFVRWCRYAAFEIPAHFPDTVEIFRGGAGLSAFDLACGPSWTTSLKVAHDAARRFSYIRDAAPVIVSALVPKSGLVAYLNGRLEHEVFLELLPPRGWITLDD